MHKLTASIIPLLIGLPAYAFAGDFAEIDQEKAFVFAEAAYGRAAANVWGSEARWSPSNGYAPPVPWSPHRLDAGLLDWENNDKDRADEIIDPTPYGIKAPPAPALIAPADSAKEVPTSVTLQWVAVGGAEGHQVQLTQNSFSAPLYEYFSAKGSNFQVGLSHSSTYYWRVRARQNGEYGPWSETRMFTTRVWVNSPPYVYNFVDDITLTLGAEHTIPYIFVDDDWTPLTYTASTSDDEIVAVELINYEITVTAISTGSATITATAADPHGATATHSFKVIVAPGVGTGHAASDLPNSFALRQNYPNPFNPRTVIAFDLPRQSSVTLKLYDMLGKEVAILASGEYPAGRYQAAWDASGFPSGVYLYQLEAETYSETRRLVLQR